MEKNQKILKHRKGLPKNKFYSKATNLYGAVDSVLKKQDSIMKLVLQKKTPFYIFDEKALDSSIDSFLGTFKKVIPSFKAYYALKINHHPLVVKRIVEKGMGLDVASRREIEIAIDAGCKEMVYFSPGKTEDDLLFALKHSHILVIHIDSFGELKRLGELTNQHKKKIKVGVRIHTDLQNDWKKYGIHIKKLKTFWMEAEKYPLINLQGIHFHTSRNNDAVSYEKTIEELGTYLKTFFKKDDLEKIKYIDFGGGFEPYESEGYFLYKKPKRDFMPASHPYQVKNVAKIEEYAKRIGKAIDNYLSPMIDVTYYAEPGRFICNSAMDIVLSVVDVKDQHNVILNGGVNMVGWQRFESEYFPLINLSSPSKKEMGCNMWGNLCTTWDIWGYYCYAKSLGEGDIIVVPNQGALTYSLAQNFIQPIPPVYKL